MKDRQPLPDSSDQQLSPPVMVAAGVDAEWLASLNHELRSPLAAIQGYATLLLRHGERLSTTEMRDFLLLIQESSLRMEKILSTMNMLAVLESDLAYWRPTNVDLMVLIRRTIETFLHGLQQGNLPLRSIRLPDDSGSTFCLWADTTLLELALMHMLENAHKFSVSSAPITVTLLRTDHLPPHAPAASLPLLPAGEKPSSWIEICIRDEGIGIADSEQEHIFERFYQVDRSLTREVSGLGLGLTICKYIVHLHHGSIWVESQPGVGSTFHVLLPVYEEERKDEHKKELV